MLPKYSHSAMIVGQTGCGKTKFVLDLLQTPQIHGGYYLYFEYIVIICPTIKWNQTYQDREWIWKEDAVHVADLKNKTLHDTIKDYYEIFKGNETLFIIDDCSAIKSLKYRSHHDDEKCMLTELANSGRHANISCWILTQKYNSVQKDFREQIKWLCMFYCKDRDSFDNCLKENDVIEDKNVRDKIKKDLKNRKHAKLILKTDQPTNYIII